MLCGLLQGDLIPQGGWVWQSRVCSTCSATNRRDLCGGQEAGQPQSGQKGRPGGLQNKTEEQQPDEARPETAEQPMERSEVDRFLDALEQNEESLPVQRARQRSRGRRPPEKDW